LGRRRRRVAVGGEVVDPNVPEGGEEFVDTVSDDSLADPDAQVGIQAVPEACVVEDVEQVLIGVAEGVEGLQESGRRIWQVVVMQPVDVGAADVPCRAC
jgi:ribosomal protein L4